MVVRSVLRQARSGTNNSLPARWQHWSRHGKMKGFDIEVTVQPAQSPDLRNNDLAFFASLQKDTDLVAKENVKDLVAAVKLRLDEYHCGDNGCCAALPFCELHRYHHDDERQQLQPSYRQ